MKPLTAFFRQCARERYITGAMLMLVMLAGCRVTLVPEYNANLEEKIVQYATANEKMYLDMLEADTAGRTYAQFAARYSDIEAGLYSIQLLNETRSNNADILKIISNLNTAFRDYRNAHKSKGILSNGEIMLYKEYIKALWKPLLVAEQALHKTRK